MDFELRTIFRREDSFDEVLLQLTQVSLSAQSAFPRKVLFWGNRAGEISSYVAGWLAGKGIAVIVLDGANRFDPYTVSSLARRAWIPPEKLLKSIRIARAFTCYQMATLMGERLTSLLRQEGATELRQRPWVILLGPLTTFLDEDVSEREVRPLFERSLRKIGGMASKGVPFLLFQSNPPSPPLRKGGEGGLMSSKRAYLMRRLFQFSDEAWRVDLDGEGPKMILEKGATELQIADRKSQIEKSVAPPFTGSEHESRTRRTSDGQDSSSF
jgi:hypothetical protein